MSRCANRRGLLLAAAVVAVAGSVQSAFARSEVYEQTLRSTTWVVAKTERGLSRGSGMLIDAERALVLTNYHVVLDAREALVFFPDFTKDGRLVAERDHYVRNVESLGIHSKVVAVDRRRDLALIQLPEVPAGVPALEMAEEPVGPGETVHSLGNPAATGALWVYTSGTVRAVYRKQFRTDSGEHDFKAIETSSPINAGDSGGPVVNDAGQLVGVSQSMSVKARLISNCVDVSEVRNFLDSDWKPAPLPLADVLDAAELEYTPQGESALAVGFEVDGAMQKVFATRQTESYQRADVRKVWSLAATLTSAPKADLMLRLLDQNSQTKMGAWTVERSSGGRYLVIFVAKVDATASPEALRSAMDYVARVTAALESSSAPKAAPASDWFAGTSSKP